MGKNIPYLINLTKQLEAVSLGRRALIGRQIPFKGVAIVGSSCAGKTTLINEIRNSSLCKSSKVVVPARYATRPKRKNDDLEENIYISKDEFIKKVESLEIGFYWKKKMDEAREEIFGFEPSTCEMMPVYSGNNGLLYNEESLYPREILYNILLIGVYAPDQVRRERLFMRSPDLAKYKQEEIRYRLEDSSEKLPDRVHIIINNYGSYMDDSRYSIVELIRRIVTKDTVEAL